MFKSAKVVWADNEIKNQYLSFRHKFYCDSVSDCKMLIRCHSNYILFINGSYVASGQYQDYDFYKVVDTIDVKGDLLKKGENLISVLAYSQFEDFSTYKKGTPGLIFELKCGDKVVAASGDDTLVRKSLTYESGDIEKITVQLGFTFHYDSTKYDGWVDADNIDGFVKSTVISTDNKYFERPVKKLVLDNGCQSNIFTVGEFVQDNMDLTPANRIYTALMRPKNFIITELNGNAVNIDGELDGVYFMVDLLRERAGYLTFDISVEEDCLIDIGYGEHLTDLRTRTSVGRRNFACSYYAKSGRNTFTHYFTRFAGRYIQVHVYSKKVSVNYFGLKNAIYPLKVINEPTGLDSLEKQIYKVSIDTLRLCMHEHYEDCPWREQALYTMDSHNQMLAGYYAFEEFDFAKACIRLMSYGMREDGFLDLCAPSGGLPPIPSFTAIWVINLYEYVLYSKDFDFAYECMPVAEKILETFNKLIKNGVVNRPVSGDYWNFYDWSDGLSGHIGGDKNVIEDDSLLNIFYAYALKSYVQLLEILGDNEKAEVYHHHYINIKKAINERYLDTEFKGYIFSNQQKFYPELAQAISILSGVCPKHYEKDILDGIKTDKYKPFTTFSYKIFKYDSLLTDPRNKDFVRNDILNIWSKMLFDGATSFWETDVGQADFKNAGSLCHGWSAIPAYFYFKL